MLIEFDKAGAEWVVVAYLSGDSRMLEVIKNKRDPHLVTGSTLSGVSEELVKQEDKLLNKSTDPSYIEEKRKELPKLLEGDYFLPPNMSIRQAGKKANHSLNYGLGYKTFALKTEMVEKDAKRLVESYRNEVYPGIPVWWETTRKRLANNNNILENCFGRKYKFMHPKGPDLFEAAYSFVPQSTVADVTNRGMILTYEDNSPDFQSVELLAQVHDSIIVQTPFDDYERVARVCLRIALDYMNPTLEYNSREFHIGTDIKIGHNRGNMQEVPLGNDTKEMAESLRKMQEELDGAEARRLA